MAEKETKNKPQGNNLPKGNKKPSGGSKFTARFNPIYFYGILLMAFVAIQYYNGASPIETSLARGKKYNVKKWRR